MIRGSESVFKGGEGMNVKEFAKLYEPVCRSADEVDENLYEQYDGNTPVIFGDKNQLSVDTIKAIKNVKGAQAGKRY